MQRYSPGPSSRSAYIFSFKMPYKPPQAGEIVTSYELVGGMICSYLSVLYGKRFDSHGAVQSIGTYGLPDLKEYGELVNENLPFNSHEVRRDFAVELNLENAKSLLPLMTGGVDASVLRVFRSAAKFYHHALQAAESDPEVAYLDLVTAGEILAGFEVFSESELFDPIMLSALKKLEACVDCSEDYSVLKRTLFQVKRRFELSILRNIDDGFFIPQDDGAINFSLKKEDISQRIKAAYDLRSNYLHSGRSFGPWVAPSSSGHEVQIGKPVVDDAKFAKVLALAPTFLGLERIIRYALLTLLQKHGVPIAVKDTVA
ncbi:HEPN domain-containing protein [Pseudomonas sediminis]|uniref:Apea-like HEPN domain-containing protein n=1 Tax=Pseudomonas sediminis TaxID=1691904 RepID=A0ABX6SDW6_9PSED|nr:HEPN domain-containing protein [Pseudomonas sediminis]QNG99675.1 hypothetical protein HNQ25_15355 [Pseudomonas sediminis]